MQARTGLHAERVEKPHSGFSASFLQSAARTPCAPMAHNSYSSALRAAFGGCALHSAAAPDLPRESLTLFGWCAGFSQVDISSTSLKTAFAGCLLLRPVCAILNISSTNRDSGG